MVPQTAQSLTQKRRPGPPPFFDGPKLNALAAYLATEGSTIKGAAETFDCSVSLIEKVINEARKRNCAPTTDTREGDCGQSEDLSDHEVIVADQRDVAA